MKSKTPTSALHCLGNGHLCAYGMGPSLVQLFGPPYSSPSALALEWPDAADYDVERPWGTNRYVHEHAAGRVEDLVAEGANVFARRLDLREPVECVLRPHPDARVFDNTARYGLAGDGAPVAAAMVVLPEGTPVWYTYPMRGESYTQVIVRNGAILAPSEGGGEWRIRFEAGRGLLLIAGGPGLPACVEQAEAALARDFESLAAGSDAVWRGVADRIAHAVESLPPAFADVAERAQDVGFLVRAQQGADGAVLAGHLYHLGYVRDQYGVFRGLVRMGLVDEARALVMRFRRVFEEFGRIHNAHGIGVGGIKHVHENDDVEQTGYLLLQSFEFADAAGEPGVLDDLAPMMAWAWRAQVRWLRDGMLPFNGDETYVAGGVLPRHRLDDGSAESTLLFLESGARLARWLDRRGPVDGLSAGAVRAQLGPVLGAYHDNFVVGGRLAANNPRRATAGSMPRFRHGVCESSGRIGWTERAPTGRYVSPELLARGEFPPAVEGRPLFVRSCGFFPALVGSDLLSPEVYRADAGDAASALLAGSPPPSDPSGDKTVGYDFGLLLAALHACGDPRAAEAAMAVMGYADERGAWSEYYVEGRPSGCRCRPWESAINIEALLRVAQSAG